MKISVIIPTHKNVYLQDCLDALDKQEGISKEDYEVIVVENPEETHPTRSLVRSYENENFIYTTSELGANEARNKGGEIARGDILCFTDDDCVPNPNWVSRLYAVHTLHPNAGCVGGPMFLEYNRPKPKWMVEELAGLLGRCELKKYYDNDVAFEIFPFDKSEHGWLSSGNLSVRKEIFKKTKGFPKNAVFVYKGQRAMAANDEVEFTHMCTRLGSPGMIYAPSAWLHHTVLDEKTKLSYLKKRFFIQGFSDGVILKHQHPSLKDEEMYDTVLRKHEALCVDFPFLAEVESELDESDCKQYVMYLTICKTLYLMGIQEGCVGKRIFNLDG